MHREGLAMWMLFRDAVIEHATEGAVLDEAVFRRLASLLPARLTAAFGRCPPAPDFLGRAGRWLFMFSQNVVSVQIPE